MLCLDAYEVNHYCAFRYKTFGLHQQWMLWSNLVIASDSARNQSSHHFWWAASLCLASASGILICHTYTHTPFHSRKLILYDQGYHYDLLPLHQTKEDSYWWLLIATVAISSVWFVPGYQYFKFEMTDDCYGIRRTTPRWNFFSHQGSTG